MTPEDKKRVEEISEWVRHARIKTDRNSWKEHTLMRFVDEALVKLSWLLTRLDELEARVKSARREAFKELFDEHMDHRHGSGKCWICLFAEAKAAQGGE